MTRGACLLLAASVLAGCATQSPRHAICAPEKFDAFLARFATDREFALEHTVTPLETIAAVEETKSFATRDMLAKAPLLDDVIKNDKLSAKRVETPGAVELNVFRPDSDSHMYYYRFRQQNGCWYLWQFEDASL